MDLANIASSNTSICSARGHLPEMPAGVSSMMMSPHVRAMGTPHVGRHNGFTRSDVNERAWENGGRTDSLERLLLAVGSLKSVWPTTADSGVCPNCQDIFEVGAPVDSPIIFVPGPAAADAPALRKAIAELFFT
jgi:hypothetical protein